MPQSDHVSIPIRQASFISKFFGEKNIPEDKEDLEERVLVLERKIEKLMSVPRIITEPTKEEISKYGAG